MKATLTFENGATVEFESVITVPIAKAGDVTRAIDLAAVAAGSVEYLIRYGVKQSLNDGAAGAPSVAKGGTADAVLGMVDKRIDAIVNGTIRQTERTGDSVLARAIAIAMRHAPKGEPDEKRAWAKAAVKRNPAFMSLAQKQIDEEKALGEIDLTV